MTKKILIMGLPKSGKTTLAKELCPLLQAVHFDADEVRQNINKDLGFSEQDRIEQARRMGWLCDKVIEAGHFAVASFICPTDKTREAFGPCFTVWLDTVDDCEFEDTNKIFEPPVNVDYIVNTKSIPPFKVAVTIKNLVL